jgi:hypothetical protein
MKKLLFLDIDGVLNDPGEIWLTPPLGPDKLTRLQKICFFTGCEIVLSSSWRFYTDLIQELREAFQPLGFDISAILNGNDDDRGKEIVLWLDRKFGNKVVTVAVLDDSEFALLKHPNPNWVCRNFFTDGSVGLTDNDTEEIIAFFQSVGSEVKV